MVGVAVAFNFRAAILADKILNFPLEFFSHKKMSSRADVRHQPNGSVAIPSFLQQTAGLPACRQAGFASLAMTNIWWVIEELNL